MPASLDLTQSFSTAMQDVEGTSSAFTALGVASGNGKYAQLAGRWMWRHV